MSTTIEYTQSRQETELQREREYYRAEEATDIAERLGYAMDHTMTHHIIAGHVYDDNLTRVADHTQKSLDEAPSKFFGPNAFEVERQRIEHDRVLRFEALVRGELDGNAIIEYSPIPDEVRNGTATIQGYRPDLMRDFVRIHYVDGDKLKTRLVSLDQSNPLSRQKVGELLDLDLSAGRSDRAILADEKVCVLNAEQVDELVEMAKLIHDQALSEQGRGHFRAGSRFAHKEDALSIVYQHGDLLEEHMTHWSRLVGLGRDRQAGNGIMNSYRKNTAAAIDLRLKGEAVGSSSESSVSTHASEGNFDSYCPTGTSVAEKMAMGQGRNEWKYGNCRVCLEDRKVGACDVCLGCEKADNRGKSLDAIYKAALRRRQQSKQSSRSVAVAPEQSQKRADVKTVFGHDAEERTTYSVGSADVIVYDRRTGEAIAKRTTTGYVAV